jgi:hypothetical protein
MKKLILTMTLSVFIVSSLKADEGQAPPPQKAQSTTALLMNWFTQLEQSLSASSVGQSYENRNDLVSVAAVRGSKQDLSKLNEPTWEKSNVSQREQILKERKEFAAAVKEVVSGKLKQAQADLKAFEKSHPSSPLLKDVKKAEEKIAELGKLNAKDKDKGKAKAPKQKTPHKKKLTKTQAADNP